MQMINQVTLKYWDTDIDMMLGDKIRFKKMFKTVSGEVVYVPMQSPLNKAFGDDTWAIQLDDEPNDVRSMIFVPDQEPFAHKKVTFIERGPGQNLISEDEEIL